MEWNRVCCCRRGLEWSGAGKRNDRKKGPEIGEETICGPFPKWAFVPLPQIQAEEETVSGQSVENQRTTFVKQLKLGKVRWLCGRLGFS